MRLLVLGPGHPFRGGISATTTAAVLALRGAGHEAAFITPLRQYPPWLYPGGSDRDPEACPRVEGAVPLLDPFAPRSWPRLRRAALAAGADAWILPYWTWAWAPVWRFLLGTPGRPPAVVVAHNPADHGAGPVRRLAAALVLGRAEGLFTHGSALAERLRTRFPGLPVASHLLPPTRVGELPPRQAARERLGIPAGARVALVLGLVRRYKGVDVLLEALARLAEGSPWTAVVAGEAWEGLDRELPGLVRRLGVEGRVHFRFGWVPEEEVGLLLAAADLMVLPYRSGSQSAVAPLALAHGLPLLVTRVGGLPEMAGEGGVVVPPEDPDALAAALASLDDTALARLAEGAALSARRLGWQGYARALAALAERVAS